MYRWLILRRNRFLLIYHSC